MNIEKVAAGFSLRSLSLIIPFCLLAVRTTYTANPAEVSFTFKVADGTPPGQVTGFILRIIRNLKVAATLSLLRGYKRIRTVPILL